LAKQGWIRVVGLVASGAIAALAIGCGRGDFERHPRPPITLQLSGVISTSRVTVSPARFGAGPVVLTIANETQESHTVTLQGQGIVERVGPVNPFDTAEIQKTLASGQYSVRADSSRPPKPIAPALLTVGRPRATAQNEPALP
jgi:hypothetical protein